MAALVLLLVIAFGGSLRLTAALDTDLVSPLQGDSTEYVSAAYNLRQFGVFSSVHDIDRMTPVVPKPDALRDPGYPVMLALLLQGRPDYGFLHRVQLLQALLGTLVIGLSYLVAIQLLPKPAAIAVAALIAINPQLIVLGTSFLTETLFSLVVVAFSFAITRAALRGSTAWYGVAGALIGMSALVRPTLEFLPLLLVPALAWLVPRARWNGCAAVILSAALVYFPWIMRNEHAIGAPSDPTLMTNALLHGSYKDFMYQGQPRSFGFPYRFDPTSAQIKTPRQALARIAGNFESDPSGTLRWYLLSKPIRFHDWEFIEGAGDIFINTVSQTPYQDHRDFIYTYKGMRWLHWPLIAVAFIGIACALVRATRRSRTAQDCAMGLLAVTMVFVLGLHMIGLPLGRYSVPFRPLSYLFVLYAIAAVIDWARVARR